MQIALLNGERILASPGAKAVCQMCCGDVIAKCGEVNIWHWAHDLPCPWEGGKETVWHAEHKMLFPIDCTEVRLEDHRADVLFKNTVYEFQSVPLDPLDAKERQTFWESRGYGFIWIFNMEASFENFVFSLPGIPGLLSYRSFRWKWPKRKMEGLSFPYFFHFGDRADLSEPSFISVRKVHWGSNKIGGWGYQHPGTLKEYLSSLL